uniref:NADH-ubiquinone oxidoreductase chain 4 n=1 Tax=Melaenis sp. YZ-2018 TaxID=2153335 RepID=A0A343W6A0_9ANNE|nr:NADH dehydrogenase subunit 4 [Melaenis sp. YZ-2018]
MLAIILSTTPLLFLPFISLNFWPLAGASLLFISFLSIPLLYQASILSVYYSSFLFLDQMSSTLISLTLWISALMILTSAKVLMSRRKPHNFISWVILLALILIVSFSVSDLLSFYIMFESSLVPTLLLVLGWGYQPERLQAGMYLMLYTICASLPLLLSLMMVAKTNGHTSMHLNMFSFNLMTPPLSSLWWVITILAFLVKMPMFIFHLWLPKAHVEAPIAGSMILAGLLLKLGGYGMLRISLFYPSMMFKVSPFCNSVALWGGVLTSMICLRQSDIKSLIAYSSVGHMALVILGVSLLSSWGWKGALVMMLAHGLCSSCLFALANLTYESTHTRSMFLTKGLLCLFPAVSFWWFLLSICNMAAPPSINLFGEIAIITSALWASPAYMIPLGLCSFLAAAYSLFLFTSTNHGSVPQFLNTQSILSSQYYSTCLFHAAPIFLLITCPDIISSWL